MRKTLLALFCVLCGCTSTVGPLVTNISYAGHGRISVEKCMVELNRMISTVDTLDCKSTEIAVASDAVATPVAEAPKQ